MSKQSILIVTPSFKIGGIQRELSTLANVFVERGIEVTYLSLLNSVCHFELDPRVKTIVPERKRRNHIVSKFIFRLLLPFFIRKNIKKSNAQVVYSSADTFNPIVILAALGLKVRVVVKDVTKPDRHFALITRIGKKLLYPKSDGFIAQTKSAADFYSKKFNNKLNLTVIGSMIKPVEHIDHSKREKIILQVGRVSIEKGQDRMIEIFNLIQDKKDWKMCITSIGPLLDTVKQQVKDLGLEDFVKFLGFVEDLEELYSKASIFVMPSRIEGFPIALIEAMANGLPPVVFNTFPANEIIQENISGYIIEDGDNKTFANRLKRLMEDNSLRIQMGDKARSDIKRFSVTELSKVTEDFLFNKK